VLKLWTFVDEAVEPTNNAAERALRPAVLWRKGSFGSQSETGLRYAERVLTFTSTCRQLQTHPFDFLSRAILARRCGLAVPRLIPAN
jgi:transposase